MGVAMSYDNKKLENAILYFVTECQNQHLGRTKLMKLLYYLDFDHFERELKPVTGARYRNLEHGPVPVEAPMMIRALENSDMLDVEETSTFHRFRAHQSPDLSVFTESELETMRNVAATWRDASTRDIEDASHAEAPWRLTAHRDDVPWEFARMRVRERPTADEEEPLSSSEREIIIDYILSTQRLEGVELTREEAEMALDEVYSDEQPALL